MIRCLDRGDVEMKRCVKIIVSGKVQGVLYREFVQKNATKLGVEGSAQNQEDGAVIIYACAVSEILDDFIDVLYKGSPKSKVEGVAVSPLSSDKEYRGVFRVIGRKD